MRPVLCCGALTNLGTWQAAEVDPQSARAFAARAHAHIKLEDYMPAVEDAARAVHLDPTLAVAYMRQG